MTRRRKLAGAKTVAAVVVVAAVVALSPIAVSRATGGQPGSDDRAQAVVSEIAPTYVPWFRSVLRPEAATSTLLFALQAGLGTAFLGYYFVSRASKRRREASMASGPTSTPLVTTSPAEEARL